MKVTLVSLVPTESAQAANRPALTPELLAASGARYSRNNEGLEAILARIDPSSLDRSVDSIFRMVDYGHQSIADMAPVALFLDDISLYLAYYLWTLAPMAGGQESSTRYIKLHREGLVSAEDVCIPEERRSRWHSRMEQAFQAYQSALQFWEEQVQREPACARIPASLWNDSSDKARKAVARMLRNYAFDRARYFLPVAALTNVMLVMSARGWVTVCQHLLSHPLGEARQLGAKIREELALATPRLLRHAVAKPSLEQGLARELQMRQAAAAAAAPVVGEASANPCLDVYPPEHLVETSYAQDLEFHDNRYAYFGESLRRTGVRFAWDAVAFAEVRDLNRHRTGTKHCPLVPRGFYCAQDQLPGPNREYESLSALGVGMSEEARQELQSGNPTYIYHTLLGTQYYFEHITTADKFLYEAELRTGTGAHFRYAQHLRDVLALWYDRYPDTRGLVQEGSAEPE